MNFVAFFVKKMQHLATQKLLFKRMGDVGEVIGVQRNFLNESMPRCGNRVSGLGFSTSSSPLFLVGSSFVSSIAVSNMVGFPASTVSTIIN